MQLFYRTPATLALLAIAFEPASAFAPPMMPSASSSSSAMNLVPEQGRQLIAYSQSYLAKKAKESASKASNLASDRRRTESSSEGGLIKARNLMTRLLHLSPSNAGADRYRDLEHELIEMYSTVKDDTEETLSDFE